MCFFVIVAIVDCLRCKTIITKDITEGSLYLVMKIHAIIRLICFGIYFLSLIPVGDDSESQYEELLVNANERLLNERSPMNSSQTSYYGGFREDTDPNYLGVAREGANWWGKLFLYWVNPLILKGIRLLLTCF